MATLHRHSKKDAIIQFRVNVEDKSIIQRAADLRGIEPSAYIRSLILESAKKDIRESLQETNIFLTSEEWEHFLNIMNAPVRLNKNLKKAFADYKKKYG